MKLSQKYTIAYAIITFVVLNIGFSITYNAINRSSERSLAGKLEALNAVIAAQLRSGKKFSTLPSGKNVTIRALGKSSGHAAQLAEPVVRREWNDELQSVVPMLYFSSFAEVNGQRFRITSKAFISKPDDIYFNGIILVFAWTFVFLLALVVVMSEILSWYMLKPFYDTLEAMQLFTINQENTINVHDTQTYEFRELNDFLVGMTNRAKKDYIAIKEFSENTSHELQTPVATIKAKLELLMETPLQESQLKTISEIHNELERLSRINGALTLLAKLEHYELDDSEQTDISAMTSEILNGFADLMEMKGIRLKKEIKSTVRVSMAPSLAQILLTNLVSNAIRHNLIQGELQVTLSTRELCISNTGAAPSIPVDQLFGRFRRGNSSLDSIGIGLAIVKKICELYRYPIAYTYKDSIHGVRVSFIR